MALQLHIHNLAQEELEETAEHYEEQKTGLGTRFSNAVFNKIVQILAHPQYYTFARGTYRQARVDGFPFTIIFQHFPRKQIIFISSISHYRKSDSHKFRKRM